MVFIILNGELINFFFIRIVFIELYSVLCFGLCFFLGIVFIF